MRDIRRSFGRRFPFYILFHTKFAIGRMGRVSNSTLYNNTVQQSKYIIIITIIILNYHIIDMLPYTAARQTKVIADILGKTDIEDLLQSGEVKLDSNGNVTYVDLYGRMLTSLPEGMAAWTTSATWIDLSNNNLTSLLEGVAAWTSATEINLSNNSLTSLQAGVAALTTIATEIDLSDNNLTSLLTFLGENQKRGLKVHSIRIVGRSAKYTKLDVICLYSYRTCIILYFLKVSLKSALSSLFYQNRCPIPG